LQIKAIETTYAGCRFRSRLEARWAVFFDHLGTPWQYEAEGYETSGGRYLPDFWLPEVEVWVEVKGELSHPALAKLMKAIPDLRPSTRRLVPQLVLLGSVPAPGEPWTHTRFDTLRDLVLVTNAFWDVNFHGEVRLTSIGHSAVFDKDYDWMQMEEERSSVIREMAVNVAFSNNLVLDAPVNAAYVAARSARFEFGANGADF
jgi:hypothetical protein